MLQRSMGSFELKQLGHNLIWWKGSSSEDSFSKKMSKAKAWRLSRVNLTQYPGLIGIMKGIIGIIKAFLWSMCECWQCTGSIYEDCRFLLLDVQCLNYPQMTLATLLLWRQTSPSSSSVHCQRSDTVCARAASSKRAQPPKPSFSVCLSCPHSLFAPVRFLGPSLPCWRR